MDEIETPYEQPSNDTFPDDNQAEVIMVKQVDVDVEKLYQAEHQRIQSSSERQLHTEEHLPSKAEIQMPINAVSSQPGGGQILGDASAPRVDSTNIVPQQQPPAVVDGNLTKKDFKQLFSYEENDRSSSELKREYKRLLQQLNGQIKFRNIVDYYLSSSQIFATQLRAIDSKKILQSISVPDISRAHRFNEQVMRVLCLNQSIEKMQRELSTLFEERDKILDVLENGDKAPSSLNSADHVNSISDKLANFLMQVRLQNSPASQHQQSSVQKQQQQQTVNSRANSNKADRSQGGNNPTEFDNNFHQIDLKLNSMMDYMTNFIKSINDTKNTSVNRSISDHNGLSVSENYEQLRPASMPIRRDYGGGAGGNTQPARLNQRPTTSNSGLPSQNSLIPPQPIVGEGLAANPRNSSSQNRAAASSEMRPDQAFFSAQRNSQTPNQFKNLASSFRFSNDGGAHHSHSQQPSAFAHQQNQARQASHSVGVGQGLMGSKTTSNFNQSHQHQQAVMFNSELINEPEIMRNTMPQHTNPSSAADHPASTRSHGMLTGQVWPKTRMLFAVVSKMSKEGLLTNEQRGVLKDLILDYDSRLMACLQEYDRQGDKDKLYYEFLQLASMHQ